MMDKQVLGKIENGKYYFKAANQDGNLIEIIYEPNLEKYLFLIQTALSNQYLTFEPDELKEAIELLEILISKGI